MELKIVTKVVIILISKVIIVKIWFKITLSKVAHYIIPIQEDKIMTKIKKKSNQESMSKEG